MISPTRNPSRLHNTLSFILHNGQPTSQAFSAKALSTETIDDFKSLIKIVRNLAFNTIPADKLKLVHVDIPDDPAIERRPVFLSHLAFVRPLRATELLRDVFSDLLKQGMINVVIESAKPLASAAATHSTRGDKNDDPWTVLLIVRWIIYKVALRYIDKLSRHWDFVEWRERETTNGNTS
ncbi:hypothetical protein BGZ93_003424 [Podila epicladia]|nr:hypothetical protein BGZ92_001221 [Podila epicladia]KAG0097125.1 hypothetical protein BGZ93_003424 [Podila epicladia]